MGKLPRTNMGNCHDHHCHDDYGHHGRHNNYHGRYGGGGRGCHYDNHCDPCSPVHRPVAPVFIPAMSQAASTWTVVAPNGIAYRRSLNFGDRLSNVPPGCIPANHQTRLMGVVVQGAEGIQYLRVNAGFFVPLRSTNGETLLMQNQNVTAAPPPTVVHVPTVVHIPPPPPQPAQYYQAPPPPMSQPPAPAYAPSAPPPPYYG